MIIEAKVLPPPEEGYDYRQGLYLRFGDVDLDVAANGEVSA